MNSEPNLPIDKYLPSISSVELQSPSVSIIKIIAEKNNLIEKYKSAIEIQNEKHQAQIDEYTEKLSKASKEIILLKSKLSSIQTSDIVELVNYYETEISNILSSSEHILSQYKSKISFLANQNNSSKQTDKLRKVIETLMKENEELKEKNDSLWKINRMNEAYKSLAKQYGNKVIENKKNIENFQKEQISQLNNLTVENKRLKDEKEEDKKIINNLMNTIEYLKTKYQDTSATVTNVTNNKKQLKPTNINNINNSLIILNKANSSLSLLSSSSLSNTTRKMMLNYADNQAMIELDNLKLDKYLNSCKMIIGEKVSTITSILQNIVSKINKENSIYKKIVQKNINEIEDNLIIISKETATLIKRANSAFNSSRLSKNLLRDIVNDSKNMHTSENKKVCIDDNVVDLVKQFLNTFN